MAEYELKAFNLIFKERNIISLSDVKNVLEENKVDLTKLLLNSCVKKKYIKIRLSNKCKIFIDFAVFVIRFPILFFLVLITNEGSFSDVSLFIVFFSIAWFLTKYFIKGYRSGVGKFGMNEIKLTEKGENIYKEIVGYKFYLEKCEEKEITNNLSDRKLIHKIIPYAIVFKLNWKILEDSF